MKRPSIQMQAAVTRAVWIGVIALCPLRAAAEPDAQAVPLEPTKAAKKASYENQVVCTYRTPVGSRIARKSCYTRAQADAESANVDQTMRDMARQADRNARYETGDIR